MKWRMLADRANRFLEMHPGAQDALRRVLTLRLATVRQDGQMRQHGGPDREHLQPRARQNVIGEMFWFAGKLGRQRVCALKKGDVEMPSDFADVGYTKMDDLGAWKTDLLKELKAAGYEVDWGKALA
jgi:predicted nucleotide-binding protein